ncbi:MAG TPA: hypothetical protein DEA08_06515 [Planctomycetes bacterium]|nr:hypothetical protein [Planctomycetota bacterium]
MSDARRQELERLAASGDPEARQAWLHELARIRDPSLLAAAALRRELRAALFELLDDTPRGAAARCAPLLAIVAEALESDLTPEVGFAQRELAAGRWYPEHRARLHALVVRVEEDLVVGLGIARAVGSAGPGSHWEGLSGWRPGGRPATQAQRLRAWAEDEAQRVPAARSIVQRVLRAPAAVARELCRFEASAGPRGYASWASLDPEPYARPQPADAPQPARKDAKRLEALLAPYSAAERAAITREHLGRADPSALSKLEAKELLIVLEAWAGVGTALEPEDHVRVEALRARLQLGPSAWSQLLHEVAQVEHLDLVPRERLPELLRRLREREGGRGAPAASAVETSAPVTAPGGELPWTSLSCDDAAFVADLSRRDDPEARRRIGGQWTLRLRPGARYADLPSLSGPPRERWRIKVPGRSRPLGLWAASPLGVVVASKQAVHLLCSDTGELRHELPKAKAGWQFAETVVLALGSRQLAGYDLWTGRELYRIALAGKCEQARRVGEVLVLPQGRAAYSFADPERPPELLWKSARGAPRALAAHPRRVELAFAMAGSPLSDAEGGLRAAGRYYGYFTDPDELEPRWTLGMGFPVALGPERLGWLRSSWLLDLHPRSDGEVPSGGVKRLNTMTPAWLSRDALLLAEPNRCVEALAWPSWSQRWAVELEGTEPFLAPGWRRVYALVGPHQLACLEEADAEA